MLGEWESSWGCTGWSGWLCRTSFFAEEWP